MSPQTQKWRATLADLERIVEESRSPSLDPITMGQVNLRMNALRSYKFDGKILAEVKEDLKQLKRLQELMHLKWSNDPKLYFEVDRLVNQLSMVFQSVKWDLRSETRSAARLVDLKQLLGDYKGLHGYSSWPTRNILDNTIFWIIRGWTAQGVSLVKEIEGLEYCKTVPEVELAVTLYESKNENTRLKARNTMLQGKLGVADKKNKSVNEGLERQNDRLRSELAEVTENGENENDALEQKNAQLECELAEAKIKINSLLMVGLEKETTRLECEVEAAHKETERRKSALKVAVDLLEALRKENRDLELKYLSR